MRYAQVGQDHVSVIGLGAWQFGAREWDWRESSHDEAIRIVERALELGINLIDTAEIYGRGRSEELIGEALRGKREKAWVASKIFPVLPLPERMHRAAAASLARLKTSHLDLYQFHFDNPFVPLSIQMRGIKNLQTAGLIRHAGVSNFSLRRWQRAENALEGPVMTNQVQYHLLKRNAEEMLEWARAKGRFMDQSVDDWAKIWPKIKAFLVIVFGSILAVKFANYPIERITFVKDIPTLVSLLLAFFSIWLSANFYRMAADASDRFSQKGTRTTLGNQGWSRATPWDH